MFFNYLVFWDLPQAEASIQSAEGRLQTLGDFVFGKHFLNFSSFTKQNSWFGFHEEKKKRKTGLKIEIFLFFFPRDGPFFFVFLWAHFLRADDDTSALFSSLGKICFWLIFRVALSWGTKGATGRCALSY